LKRVLILTVLALIASVIQIYGHHSDEATYRVTAFTQLEGQVSQIQIRNPHSWVFIDVTDANGQMKRWGAEWRGATQLAREGVNTNTLKVGEKVVIKGNPSRNPNDNRVLLVTITRVSDGKIWGERLGGE